MRESNAQQEHNLISMNPLSKHMSTPDFMGGARYSPISNQNKGYASPASMLGDLDKNGVMSEYETKRQTAINENTD